VKKSHIMLYYDNKATINIANNSVQHDRTKHVEIDRHFIKEKLDSGEICLPFVRTTKQLADVFNKGLDTAEFSNVIYKMNMKNIYIVHLEGECCKVRINRNKKIVIKIIIKSLRLWM
jgi:hypothetical protein